MASLATTHLPISSPAQHEYRQSSNGTSHRNNVELEVRALLRSRTSKWREPFSRNSTLPTTYTGQLFPAKEGR